MSSPTDVLERYAHLWEELDVLPRWIIWRADAGETFVFDRHLNIPVDVDDTSLAEVLRRMREAGAPETDSYPGRRCG
ncbi:hypothetical protein ACIGZH_30505 [Streptomyces sp. NPDC058319]|uniref:hypothetical protein n=1 Tax=unclassified Streptomyces TaxID=2593676 RepID=UPI0036F0BB9B